MIYRHTQIGTVILAAAAPILVVGVIAWVNSGVDWLGASIVGVAVLTASLFGSLTVEVDHDRVRSWFGVGLIRKQINAVDITDVKTARTRWFDGWGVRLTREGWVHNVSGFDVVRITLVSGRKFGIGTDEPLALLTAIRECARLPG